MTEKQTALLHILLDTLAVDFAEGVLPELIVGSDEYGQYLFPQSEYAWDETGSVEILVDVHDDKRQFTGNVLHNAAGELIGWHGIYQGTTDRVLPSAEARATRGAENFLFSKTLNHWSNLTEKKRLVEYLVAYRTKVCLHQLP